MVEDACAASSAAAHATTLKALETRGIAVVQSSGPEVGSIPDATLELGVDLPVPRPPDDETYAAVVARLDSSARLAADHGVDGAGSRPPSLDLRAVSGAAGAGLQSPDSFSLLFPAETPSADVVDHFALEDIAIGTLSAAPPSQLSRAHSDNPTRPRVATVAEDSRVEGHGNLLLNALPRLNRAKSVASGVVPTSALRVVPETPRVPSGAPLSPGGFVRGGGVGGHQASSRRPQGLRAPNLTGALFVCNIPANAPFMCRLSAHLESRLQSGLRGESHLSVSFRNCERS